MSDETQVPASAAGDGALTQASPRGRLDEPARRQVAALADEHPNWDGVVCLPGDPSHWVHLSAGEVVSFQSFLTLRLARALGASEWPEAGALSDAMARPERLATLLRSAELSGNRDETFGALLGAELAATRIYWLGQQVAVPGGSRLADAYAVALEAQGVPVLRS